MTMDDSQLHQFKTNLSQGKKRRGRPSKRTPVLKSQHSSEEQVQDSGNQFNKKVKEYNAQLRKDFIKEKFDNKKDVLQEEDPEEFDEDNLSSKSDDEFMKELEKEKKSEVNLDRLTKRQRAKHVQENDKSNPRTEEADEVQDFSEGLPLKSTRRQIKNTIPQAQADENKRKELEKILEEQNKKMRDRNDKLKGLGSANDKDMKAALGGVLGRYVSHNQKQTLQKPGMEQFAISIKLKSFNKSAKDDSTIEGPDCLHPCSGSQLFFPKGVELPDCLRQRPASENLMKRMEDKAAESKCQICSGPTHQKKYTCPKSRAITCSFKCYKKVKV